MRRLYAYAFVDDFVLLYPLYPLLFARSGLSATEISTLFVIWSLTALALEVPAGPLADLLPRNRLLALASLLTGAGFTLWLLRPSYAGFAAGFVLWGAGGALSSGTTQALTYAALDRIGAAGRYAQVLGRSEAVRTVAVLAATALAAPVLATGGYRAVGVASIAATIVAAALAWSLPDHRHRPGDAPPPERRDRPARAGGLVGPALVGGRDRPARAGGRDGPALEDPDPAGREADPPATYLAVLRTGLAQARHARPVRALLLLWAALTGLAGSLEEYVPVLAGDTGVGAGAPVLVLLVTAGATAGGLLAGRGLRLMTPVLAGGALLLALGALVAGGTVAPPGGPLGAFGGTGPWGMLPVAVAFGTMQWVMIGVDARLQERLDDRSRATVTSIGGVGSELFGIVTYGAYAAGAVHAGTGPLLALFSVPLVLLAVALRRQHRDACPAHEFRGGATGPPVMAGRPREDVSGPATPE